MIKIAKNCDICKTKTIFYVWSTSRNFPREEMIKFKNIKSKAQKRQISIEGVPVCFKCRNDLKEYKCQN